MFTKPGEKDISVIEVVVLDKRYSGGGGFYRTALVYDDLCTLLLGRDVFTNDNIWGKPQGKAND